MLEAGHRHSDVLNYSLCQLRGYTAAHRQLKARALADWMDAHRMAAHADADGYRQYRTALVQASQETQQQKPDGRAAISAAKAFAAAGLLRLPDEPPATP